LDINPSSPDSGALEVGVIVDVISFGCKGAGVWTTVPSSVVSGGGSGGAIISKLEIELGFIDSLSEIFGGTGTAFLNGRFSARVGATGNVGALNMGAEILGVEGAGAAIFGAEILSCAGMRGALIAGGTIVRRDAGAIIFGAEI